MLNGGNSEELISQESIAPVRLVYPELLEQQKAERTKTLGNFALKSASGLISISFTAASMHAITDATISTSAMCATGGYLIYESAIGIYQTVREQIEKFKN